MEEKKAPAAAGAEEKAAGASGAGVGGEEGGANPFDFSAMSGLLNVRPILLHLAVACLWWG